MQAEFLVVFCFLYENAEHKKGLRLLKEEGILGLDRAFLLLWTRLDSCLLVVEDKILNSTDHRNDHGNV